MYASYIPFGFDGSGTSQKPNPTPEEVAQSLLDNKSKTDLNSGDSTNYTKMYKQQQLDKLLADQKTPSLDALKSKSESDLNISSKDVAYANIVKLLQSSSGRAELGDDPKKLDDINAFLRAFPYRGESQTREQTASDPYGLSSSGPWTNMSVKQIFLQSIQTAIDIINDVSKTISQRNMISATDYRRELYSAFTAPSRRTYVGIWLIFLSFILYFIDSAA
jgi:hypothetical protein